MKPNPKIRKLISTNSLAEMATTNVNGIKRKEDTKRIIMKNTHKIRIVPYIKGGDNEARIYEERNKFIRATSRNGMVERADHPFAINCKEECDKVQKKEVIPSILNTEDKGDFNKLLDRISKPSRNSMVETKKRKYKTNLTKAPTHRSCIKTVKLAKPREDPKHTFEYNW